MGIKTCKRAKTSIFIVNKILKEAKVKFLIERDKKKFIYCIINCTLKKLSIRTF